MFQLHSLVCSRLLVSRFPETRVVRRLAITLQKLKPVSQMPDIFTAILRQNSRALKKKFLNKKKKAVKPANKAILGRNRALKEVKYITRNI
jgi:hypothetical protein